MQWECGQDKSGGFWFRIDAIGVRSTRPYATRTEAAYAARAALQAALVEAAAEEEEAEMRAAMPGPSFR